MRVLVPEDAFYPFETIQTLLKEWGDEPVGLSEGAEA
jgi:hypothetical protein